MHKGWNGKFNLHLIQQNTSLWRFYYTTTYMILSPKWVLVATCNPKWNHANKWFIDLNFLGWVHFKYHLSFVTSNFYGCFFLLGKFFISFLIVLQYLCNRHWWLQKETLYWSHINQFGLAIDLGHRCKNVLIRWLHGTMYIFKWTWPPLQPCSPLTLSYLTH